MDYDDGTLFSLPEPAPEPIPFASPAVLTDIMDPGWAKVLAPAATALRDLANFLADEQAAGRRFLPAAHNILRAFQQPFDDVKVLIVGQDPYPTPGHAVGLAFAVERSVRPLPRSLANLYRELHADTGVIPPIHGDLSAWSRQGVLLLNRVLSVQSGRTGSHRNKGWEQVTELAVRALVRRNRPLVAVLWGRDAGGLAPALGETPRVESAHPSPLSASRGFFGSRPFSRVNSLLAEQDAKPVDWNLDAVA